MTDLVNLTRLSPSDSMAKRVKDICEQPGMVACTFASYAVFSSGERVIFSDQGIRMTKTLLEKRTNGRVSLGEYQYEDGSVLRFRWSKDKGARLQHYGGN